MATASPGQTADQTGLSYDRVKAALERVNNLEELCRVLASDTNIRVEPDVEAVVKRLLGEEWLTWRHLIWLLDRASEIEAAEALFGFAEPLADPTFTISNVSTVLNKAEDWRGVMELLIPDARQAVLDQQYTADAERKSATIAYYVSIIPSASWEELASALYEHEQDKAVIAVKLHLPNEKDPSLTIDNVMEALGEVEGDWRELGDQLFIPESKRDDIAVTHHSDSDRLRAVMEYWIQTSPCPAWKLLVSALGCIDMFTLAEHVRDKYCGASDQSLAQYRAAMEKGIVRTTNHNIVTLGIAGGGKTHTIYLFLEKDPPKVRSSTPCAERPVRTTHGKQDEGRWVEVDPDGQIQMLAKLAKALPGPTKQACSQQPGPTPQASSSQPQTTTPLPVSLQASIKKELNLPSRNDCFRNRLAYEMETVLTAASVEEVHFINIVDSGGQQQFHEVLPDFLPGINALLLVHNASQPLDHYPEVELYERNERVGSCHSPLTNLQIIQRCLQMAQATLVKGQCPVIVFVGTHGDLEHEWPESREMKNAKLMKLITPVIKQYVIFPGQSFDEPLCVINAKTPGPAEKKLAGDLRKQIVKHSHAKPEAIPLPWHGFVLALQGLTKNLGRGVLSKVECLEVALTLRLASESLEDALKFLGNLKQLHYYPFLPSVIFADSQILLDKISELVRFHYQLREDPSPDTPAFGGLTKFRNHGLISLDLLKEEQFSTHYVPELFGPEQLLLILEKLLLIAKVSDKDYLMPCLLPQAEGEKKAQNSSVLVSPLLVHFPGGPRLGVFCHLLAYLLGEAKWELVYEDSKPVQVNRNIVALSPPTVPCQVTLSDPFLSHFQISISNFPEELLSECPQIRATILEGIERVCAKLGYSDCVPMDAFSCSAEDCRRSSPHPATVMPGSSRKFLTCTLNKGKWSRMSDKELVWFPEKCSVQRYGARADGGETAVDGLSSDTIFDKFPECRNAPPLGPGDLGQVLRVLHGAGLVAKWRAIGQTLTVSDADLAGFDARFSGDPSLCLLHMVASWLRGQKRHHEPPSWCRLVWAVADPQGGGKRHEGLKIAASFKSQGGLSKFVPKTSLAKETLPTSLLDDFCGAPHIYESVEEATESLSRELSAVAHWWVQVGVLLDVALAWLEKKRNERSDDQQTLRDMLGQWLDSLGDVTLQRLVEAVEHSAGGSDPALAAAIRTKLTTSATGVRQTEK